MLDDDEALRRRAAMQRSSRARVLLVEPVLLRVRRSKRQSRSRLGHTRQAQRTSKHSVPDPTLDSSTVQSSRVLTPTSFCQLKRHSMACQMPGGPAQAYSHIYLYSDKKLNLIMSVPFIAILNSNIYLYGEHSWSGNIMAPAQV